jgi:hypothetical protein
VIALEDWGGLPCQTNQIDLTILDDLAMLARVLEEALEASINGAAFTEQAIQEMKPRLGKVIMESFVAGETNPARLKKIAIESVASSV